MALRPDTTNSVSGSGCVKTCASRECAELFSVLSPFYCDWQQCSFPIERNRDNISTCKFDVGVFTQAGPRTDLRSNGPRCFDWCCLFQPHGLLLIYLKGSSWLTPTVGV